jgi:hypothetical protein
VKAAAHLPSAWGAGAEALAEGTAAVPAVLDELFDPAAASLVDPDLGDPDVGDADLDDPDLDDPDLDDADLGAAGARFLEGRLADFVARRRGLTQSRS